MAAPTPPTGSTTYAGYADYVAQTLLADATGSTGAIPDPLATSGLDTAILVNPEKIQAFRESIAGQMNAQSGGPTFDDLSDRIADVIIETKVQGADTLEVHLIDPLWVIPMSGFIQTDTRGYLWPPVDINFPTGTNCTWRLCQFKGDWQASTEANLVLIFEDVIVSQLRQISPGNGGLVQGQPNQTLGEFIRMLVDNTNAQPGIGIPIKLLELLSPQDPNYTLPITQIGGPSHLASQIGQGLTGQMHQLLNNLDSHLLGVFPGAGQAGTITATEKKLASLQATDQALEKNQGYIPGIGDSNANGQLP